MKGVRIVSSAAYVPPKVLTNDDLSKLVDTSHEWIVKRTGIVKRHIAEGEGAMDMAAKVAKKLLDRASISAKEVDCIIVSTVTPDYLCPSLSCMVAAEIGADNAIAFDISAACTGFVYGMSAAHKYLVSGLYKRVMLIGSEILSRYVDWEDRGSCILFGDGAGGMILEASDNFYAESLHAKGSHVITVDKFIKVEGRAVFDFAVSHVADNINEIISKTGHNIDDIAHFIPHQANGRIIEAIAKKLNVPISKFCINISDYGNTSSASIPIAFTEMVDKGLIKPKDKIIFSGFGGGLTWGSILIDID